MSRSKKKHGIIKDRGWMVGLYNRKFRRTNKQRIKMGKRPLLMKELIDPWDVHDWVFHWEKWSWYRDYKTDEEIEKMKRVYFNK